MKLTESWILGLGNPFRKSLKRATTRWVQVTVYLPSALKWWAKMQWQCLLSLTRYLKPSRNCNNNTSHWTIKTLKQWTLTEGCSITTIFKSPTSNNLWCLIPLSISNFLRLQMHMGMVKVTQWCLGTPLTNLPFLTLGRIQDLHSMLISGRTPSPCISQSMEWVHSHSRFTSNSNSSSTSSVPNNSLISLINRIVTVPSPVWTRCNLFLISRTSGKTLTIQLSGRDKEIFLNTTTSSLSRNSLQTLNWPRSNYISSQ